MREAEGSEREIPAALHGVFREINLSLIVVHVAIVIGHTAVKL
jgi:hypothetical protein